LTDGIITHLRKEDAGINSGLHKAPGSAVVVFLASAGYLCYAPIAPGTFGTLSGIPLFLVFSYLPFLGNLAILFVFLILAVFLSSKAEAAFGRKDDGRIVIDEVAGFLVTMAGVRPGLAAVILGFLLFRAFDILKPWPVRFVDKKCPGGLGVVLDDVVAGLYSLIVLYVILYLWPSLGTTSW